MNAWASSLHLIHACLDLYYMFSGFAVSTSLEHDTRNNYDYFFCSDVKFSIYEIIHIWTAIVDESEEWSSQLIFQFK